jgi:Uncharacterized protein conserved in bacteria
MKIRLLIVIGLLLITSGCINREVKDVFVKPIQNTNEIKFLYTPGTYKGEANGYNGKIVVSVTVTDSKITAIEILQQQESNYFVDENGVAIGETIDDELDNPIDETTEGEGTETEGPEVEPTEIDVFGEMDGLINMIILEQTTNLDLSTGATITKRGLIEAIQRALAEASL